MFEFADLDMNNVKGAGGHRKGSGNQQNQMVGYETASFIYGRRTCLRRKASKKNASAASFFSRESIQSHEYAEMRLL